MLPAIIAVVVLALGAATLESRTADRGMLRVGPTSDPQRPSDDAATGPATLPTTRLDPMEVTSEVTGRGGLLPDAADLTLVAGRRDHLGLVNLATGDIRHVRLPRSAQSPPGLDAMFTRGSDLIVNHHGAVLRIAGGGDRPVLIAEGQRAVPTYGDDDALWLNDGLSSAVASTAMRVAPDGTVLERVELPAIARPVAGTADGLVVSAPGGISVINADGASEITPAGELVATDGERIAWIDCESGVRCLVMLGTVDDPDQTRIPLDPEDVPAGYFGLPTGAYSPDGRWLAFPLYRVNASGTLERPRITVVDTATGAEVFGVQGPYIQAYSALPLAWSPNSRWLFVASRDGMTTWDAGTQESATLDVDIEPPRGLAVLP